MSGYQEKLLTNRQTNKQTDRQTQPSELRLAFGNANHIADQLML